MHGSASDRALGEAAMVTVVGIEAGALLGTGGLPAAFSMGVGSWQAVRNVTLSLEWQNDYSLSH
jgi:hypothetical protein